MSAQMPPASPVPLARQAREQFVAYVEGVLPTLSDAIRVLFDNPRPPVTPGDPWPSHHPVAYTLLWAIAIVAVCAPLAVRAYDRSIAR